MIHIWDCFLVVCRALGTTLLFFGVIAAFISGVVWVIEHGPRWVKVTTGVAIIAGALAGFTAMVCANGGPPH